MSKALAAASKQAMAVVEASGIRQVDETSWIRDARRCSAWLGFLTITSLTLGII